LGESILSAGSNFAGLDWNATTIGAFLTAFVGTVAMWWIYFNVGADYASRKISESRDPGRLGRLAYTYLPIVFVGGIIVSAVGDDLMLAHPWGGEEAGNAALFAIAGGAALYVFGNLLFKASVSGHRSLSHLVGLVLFVILLIFGAALPPLIVGVFSTAILILVAAWEFISLKSLRE
ncbi:MAG TPA: low temperature requirement protein A, partial [Pararhizobium sp.]|nr:low temperature requirement protein A [Pararhizobium sp.]